METDRRVLAKVDRTVLGGLGHEERLGGWTERLGTWKRELQSWELRLEPIPKRIVESGTPGSKVAHTERRHGLASRLWAYGL